MIPSWMKTVCLLGLSNLPNSILLAKVWFCVNFYGTSQLVNDLYKPLAKVNHRHWCIPATEKLILNHNTYWLCEGAQPSNGFISENAWWIKGYPLKQ